MKADKVQVPVTGEGTPSCWASSPLPRACTFQSCASLGLSSRSLRGLRPELGCSRFGGRHLTLEVCGAIHPPALILLGRTELESKRWTRSSWGRWLGKGAGSRRKLSSRLWGGFAPKGSRTLPARE